jgi:twitching motility protein PilT
VASLPELLREMIEQGASDLHLTVGVPPMLRLHGRLVPRPGEPLTPASTKELAYSILTEQQKHKFEEAKELDLSFGLKGVGRFRANVFQQRGAVAAAIRVIPTRIPTFEALGLPKVMADLCERPRGLVLVTGPTGSGKSTTLAAMVDKINAERQEHIVTIEDPIEFVHAHKRSVVNQRELGTDTASYKAALRAVLREDPNTILIGELRDRETIEAALTIAETGHLTFGTLHTNSAVQTIHRLVDAFPVDSRPQVRAQLAFILEGIVCQLLIPRAGGQGRVLALEVLVPNAAVRNLIREDKVHQLYSVMQAGQDRHGMITMNQSLFGHYLKRQITQEDALTRSPAPDELLQMIQRAQLGGAAGRR